MKPRKHEEMEQKLSLNENFRIEKNRKQNGLIEKTVYNTTLT